jgi:hypothetical protein
MSAVAKDLVENGDPTVRAGDRAAAIVYVPVTSMNKRPPPSAPG